MEKQYYIKQSNKDMQLNEIKELLSEKFGFKRVEGKYMSRD